MARLVGAGQSDVGLKRTKNEDTFVLDNARGLYLVADGMGGHASGEVASRLVAQSVSDYVRQFLDTPLESPQRYDFYDRRLSPRANTLAQAIHLANQIVYDAAHQEGPHQGMGSTLAAVLADGQAVLVAHVGDSHVFLSRRGKLTRLTVPHRLAEDPQFKGVIDPAATIISTMGHTLTRAMGVSREVKPDLSRTEVEEGDIFLLCSDGLSDLVSEEMLAKVLSLDRDLEQMARDLIELALAGGGKDNVTAVLAAVRPPSKLKGLLGKFSGGT